MSELNAKLNPIVGLSRFSIGIALAGSRQAMPGESGSSTICGVDELGVVRVYAQFRYQDEYEAWRQADPLWRQAQSAVFRKLLANPRSRDMVQLTNIKGALDAGDTATAMELACSLLPDKLQQLIGVNHKATKTQFDKVNTVE